MSNVNKEHSSLPSREEIVWFLFNKIQKGKEAKLPAIV